MNCVLTFPSAHSNLWLLWLLCLMYLVYILDITANHSIGNFSPHQYLYGQTPGISPTLCFCFYEPVYYSDTNSFLPQLRKRGDGLVLPLTSGILSSFTSLLMTPIRLSTAQLYVPPLFLMKRTFILNSPKGRMTLANQ